MENDWTAAYTEISDNPVEKLMQMGMRPSLFPPNSRYAQTEIALHHSNGEQIKYLRRRFIPSTEEAEALQEHSIVEGDRLDNLGAQYIGDPHQFWKICDANLTLHPDDLIEKINQKIVVALSEERGKS